MNSSQAHSYTLSFTSTLINMDNEIARFFQIIFIFHGNFLFVSYFCCVVIRHSHANLFIIFVIFASDWKYRKHFTRAFKYISWAVGKRSNPVIRKSLTFFFFSPCTAQHKFTLQIPRHKLWSLRILQTHSLEMDDMEHESVKSVIFCWWHWSCK